MAERLALPTSVHGVAGSNPAGGEILPEPERCFIAQSLSCSHFHRPEMTEILLKGRKTLTHPPILFYYFINLLNFRPPTNNTEYTYKLTILGPVNIYIINRFLWHQKLIWDKISGSPIQFVEMYCYVR